MTRLDLATLHEAIAAAVPDRECLVWRDRRLTWREVADRTRRLARVLHEHGLGRRDVPAEPWESPHDHLALYLHNGPEYLEGMLGAHKARVAPFNVNYRYVGDELAYLFGDARPGAIIYHARFAGTLGQVLDRLDRTPLLLQVADESGAGLLPGALDYEAALAAASPEPLPVRPDAGDLHILYTGGTTGMPKGVLWEIGDLMAGPLGVRRRDGGPFSGVAEAVESALARPPARVLVAPPMMHGGGTWSALGGWCTGGVVVVPDRVDHLDPADLLATAARERVTRIPLVGDAFARPLAEELERVGPGAHDLSALRTIVNSAAAISPGVRERLLARLPGVRIVDVLGSSESGFQVTRQAAGNAAFTPSPGAAVVSDDRTRVLAPGEDEVGWLAKGGAIPRGYLGDPGRTAETFVTVGGRRLVVAGDRARPLADGRVEVYGREATTINTGGEKVFAEEVEIVLRDLPGVAEALVLGRPSERWGQEVVAVVRLDGAPDDAELRAGCAARLARYKIPKAFFRTAESLRLPNGKADYTTARKIVASGPDDHGGAPAE
ncbi:AMP-binding enzyme C-terminal domain-containing protein [Thermomonospora echinospora]|uniref:AMP-binding enzyme C-terminal domain-containing protein n=1 Tax=Thermomonospora echinospora TaxID=1992 RepID=A0A1H6DM76_9ACTN|nr:AMP-binding protein [Thermomonospora echinospora]SEG85826.1 AMP-binding enzyme C-terminal domain-containing protein [Thermomonospora echinospora]